ncbi:MAG: hypothetical protein RLO80_03265 [Hyphomonas sp.]
MTPSILPGMDTAQARTSAAEAPKTRAEKEAAETKLRFEQMLWAEMLTHAGLEKAFTQGGGEAASAFSRYVVEAIAKDLAEKHPMGLTAGVGAPQTGPAAMNDEAV